MCQTSSAGYGRNLSPKLFRNRICLQLLWRMFLHLCCIPWLFLELLAAHLFFAGILGVWHLVNLGFSLREEIFTSNHIMLTDTVLVCYFSNGVVENFSIHTGCGFVGTKLFITPPIISTIYKLCSDVDLYYLYRICSSIASWIPDSGSLCPHWSFWRYYKFCWFFSIH